MPEASLAWGIDSPRSAGQWFALGVAVALVLGMAGWAWSENHVATSNRDGRGAPDPSDDRILRVGL